MVTHTGLELNFYMLLIEEIIMHLCDNCMHFQTSHLRTKNLRLTAAALSFSVFSWL
jgi:hypothetical protein